MIEIPTVFRGEKGKLRIDPLWDRLPGSLQNAPQGRVSIRFIPEDGDESLPWFEDESTRFLGHHDLRFAEEAGNLELSRDLMVEYNSKIGD